MCASARVRFDTPGFDAPESVWFRFPEAYHDYLSDQSDAFLVAMMMPAMLLGEDIVVEGRVSPRLVHGIREYRTAYSQWWPGRVHHVDVRYGEVGESGQRRGATVVGGAFSGGVDSTYTVWRHMPANETVPGFALTHALMINGFNFDHHLDDTGPFDRLVAVYRPMLERNGVTLLVSRQNTEVFLDAAKRAASKSPTREGGVVSAVHMLGNLFERVYVSGSGTYRYEDNFPKGWHPSGLHLLSTERTEMMFDGGDADRAQKTVALAGWEDTYSTLRVCWTPTEFDPDTGVPLNCGTCPKCVRTMATLDAIGALGRYRTFPDRLDRRRVRRQHFVSPSEKKFYTALLHLVRKRGRADLERDIRYARIRSRIAAAIGARILRR